MFKTHLAFSVFAAILFIHYYRPKSPLLFSLVLLFSSILPDIDTRKSKIGRKTWPLCSLFSTVFGHRGFFHTAWIPIAGFLALRHFGHFELALAFFSGYSLHLLCDISTAEGLKVFSPLWKKHFRGIMKTGGVMEHLVLLLVCISIGLLLVRILG